MLFLCSFHVKHPKHYHSQEIREPFKKFLTENHFAKKPLTEKIRQVVFEGFPYRVEILQQIISMLFLMGAVPGQTNRRWRHKFAHTIFRHNVNYHRHDH